MDGSANLNFDFTDPQTITRVIGILVPIIVALVTKKVSSPGLKSVLNVALSAIGGSVAYLATADGALNVGGYVNAVLNTFITSIVAYHGFLKPTGIADAVIEKTANFGIGSPPGPTFETESKGATDEGEAVAEDLTEFVEPDTPLQPVKKAAAKKAPAKKAPPK